MPDLLCATSGDGSMSGEADLPPLKLVKAQEQQQQQQAEQEAGGSA